MGRLEERGDRRFMLLEIVEEGADVAVPVGQNDDVVAWAGQREEEHPGLVLQSRGPQGAAPQGGPELLGVTGEGGAQRGHGFRISGGTEGMIDRQAVGTDDGGGENACAPGETRQEVAQGRHGMKP